MSNTEEAKRSAVHLPPNFRQIRLELAREAAHPAGSAAHGYTIFAPLDKEGKIDPALWRSFRDFCRVVRFRPDEGESVGHLIHRPGGSWAFHYDIRGDEADEPGYHLENERFEVGEYVSIREQEKMHTFQVVTVERI